MKPVLKPRPPPLAKLPDLERETWTTEPRREHLASPADFPRPGHRAAASLSAEDTEEHGSEDDTHGPQDSRLHFRTDFDPAAATKPAA